MTNERIILLQRIRLLREGVIGSTGTREFRDYKGRPCSGEVPEDIHTAGAWLKRGYQVRPGEKACARFPIWKYRIDRSSRPPSTVFYMKDMDFFTAGQVRPLTAPESPGTAA